VGGIFNDPIKGFGVLTGYAERRLQQAVGGASLKVADRLEPSLKPLLALYETQAIEAGRLAEDLLRRYGRGVTEAQPMLKRLADVLIDLFVGLCVISRADSLMKAAAPAGAAGAMPVEEVATVFVHQSRRRIVGNLRAAARNDDAALDRVAAAVLTGGEYPWDVL
jgi:hypothetical protein